MVPAGWLSSVSYKPGWTFKLGGPGNRFVCVFARTPNSLSPSSERVTQHMFEVPDEDDPRRLARWLLDCLLLVERHEACEFLSVGGARPFWPNHQDEGDPYELVERW